MEKLTDLPGIGKVVAGQLMEVDIATPEALRQTGSRQAWLRIQGIDSSACLNRLYGLETAVRGIPRHSLPEADRAELRAFYQAHKL